MSRGITHRLTGAVGVVSLLVAVLCIVGLVTGESPTPGAHCSIPSEAYYIPDGRDYSGTVNVTEGGIPCQPWTAQSPHQHDIDVTSGEGGIGDHNYCRNPNGLPHPWCMTMDPAIPYQYCDVGEPCPIAPDAPSVSASPISGTLFRDEQSALVSLSCFPKPCEVYYTTDGTEPSPANSTKFVEPFQLSRNATVKYVGTFANGQVRHRVAFYSIQPSAPVVSGAYFVPTPSVNYTGPVLVSVQGFPNSSSVVYYVDSVFQGNYKGAFWLNQSSHVVAIVDGKEVIRAQYYLTAERPAIALFPPSGTFIGGVGVVVRPTSLYAASFYRLVGNATGVSEWVPLESLRIVLTEPGTTHLVVKGVYLGGVESIVEGNYTVLAARSPTVYPSPAVNYSRPVQVTCEDPAGRLLPLGQPQAATRVKEIEGEGTDSAEGANGETRVLFLDRPGAYSVHCTYTDDLRQTHTTDATITLVAQPLPTPAHVPVCGTSFPCTPLRLTGRIVPPSDNDYMFNGSFDRLSLNVTLAPGEVAERYLVQPLEHPTPDTVVYLLSHRAGAESNATATDAVEVVLTSSSTDAMELPSVNGGCVYKVVPLGASRTVPFVAKPFTNTSADCVPDMDGLLRDGCAEKLRGQLARCLYFNTTALITASSVGPFAVLSVDQLSASLRAPYEQRVAACLGDTAQMDVESFVSEAGGGAALATGWRVVASGNGAPLNVTAPNVTAGAYFLVEVGGFRVREATDYRFVREEYACNDIGYPAVNFPTGGDAMDRATPFGDSIDALQTAMMTMALMSGEEGGASAATLSGAAAGGMGAESVGKDTIPLIFTVPSAGRFKLCAQIAGVTYVVPARYEAMQPILRAVPAPWRRIVADERQAPCGGLVEAAHSELPLSVAFRAEPAFAVYDLFYSFDAGPWYTGRLGAALTLPRGVNSYTNKAAVVSATLGATAGTPAAVCVFFPPAVNPPVVTKGLSYRFYKVANRSEPEIVYADQEQPPLVDTGRYEAVSGVAAVVISLHGTFQIGERIVVDLYQEPFEPATNESEAVDGATWIQSVLATSSVGLNLSTAPADSTVALNYGIAGPGLQVWARLDGGERVPVAPAEVALSPLAIAMVACGECKSGYCYGTKSCVCIGPTNKTAYICADVPRPIEPTHPVTTLSERLLLLAVYFGLLAAVGVGFLWAIRAGAARSKKYAEEREAAAEEGEGDNTAVSSPPAESAAAGSSRPQRRLGHVVDIVVENDDAPEADGPPSTPRPQPREGPE